MSLTSARERSSPASRRRRSTVRARPSRRRGYPRPLRPAQPSQPALSNITGAKPGASVLLDRAASSGPSPSKQLLRGDPVDAARDLGHHRPHRQCLLENPSFLVGRPPTTTPRPRGIPRSDATTLGLGSSLWSNIFTCRSQIRDRNLPAHTWSRKARSEQRLLNMGEIARLDLRDGFQRVSRPLTGTMLKAGKGSNYTKGHSG